MEIRGFGSGSGPWARGVSTVPTVETDWHLLMGLLLGPSWLPYESTQGVCVRR